MNTYEQLLQEIQDTTLVAVSKTKPSAAIKQLYNEGQRTFGENRVAELVDKFAALPKDIEWHMIGHLQTNKVKQIIRITSLIHSGDRMSLLQEIQKQALKHELVKDVLLQIKIAKEDTKYGWSFEELLSNIQEICSLSAINIRGVMGMATFTNDDDQVRREFKLLKEYFEELKRITFPNNPDFDIVSMGMSGDYKIAIEEGANMVRIGSLLFGTRS